ncbi:MAG: hypothetical protein QGG36_23920 [Pirellulaceae bacterium]|jgi:hypothetical protein|nr:hypothetical protein [Pirellulaceae bacterium]
METSLHRQLKEIYAGDDAQTEVKLGSYRIDAVTDDHLVEIQHSSLAAIRDKIGMLIEDHAVLVVKPIIHEKRLVKLDAKGGRIVDQRKSPKRGSLLHVFQDLIHFTRVFPHPNLTLDVVLVDVEERRFPGHGRRRRWSKRDHQVEDQRLVRVRKTHSFRAATDLLRLIPGKLLPARFDTAELASALDVNRSDAQQIAYCLRKMGAAENVGKRGNALLYELSGDSTAS